MCTIGANDITDCSVVLTRHQQQFDVVMPEARCQMVEVGFPTDLTDDIIQHQRNIGAIFGFIKPFLGFDNPLDQFIAIFIVTTETLTQKPRGLVVVDGGTDTEHFIKVVLSEHIGVQEEIGYDCTFACANRTNHQQKRRGLRQNGIERFVFLFGWVLDLEDLQGVRVIDLLLFRHISTWWV